jgi:hypothetical protein
MRDTSDHADTVLLELQHFLYIAGAMNDVGRQGVALWDPEDEFFYDVLRWTDGRTVPLKVRSLIGLIPLFAVEVLESEALRRFHRYCGDGFRVECPTGSGVLLSLAEIADEVTARVVRLFMPGRDGRRPYQGSAPELPGSEDLLLFHEYFDGEDGRGLGASHQTGWTALVADLMRARARAALRRAQVARGER